MALRLAYISKVSNFPSALQLTVDDFCLIRKKDNRSIKTCRLKTFSDGMFHYQSLTRMNHIGRNDQFVKLFACQQAQFDGGFAQRFVVFVGGFGNFGGVFVADFTV